jgi:capping protein beta
VPSFAYETKQNLESIKQLLSHDKEAVDELKDHVQCPLRDAIDGSTSKSYVLCEYNQHGSSHRSPFSNQYYPELNENEQASLPSSELRKIEILANDAFESYAHLYYGKDVITSVYCWNKDADVHQNSSSSISSSSSSSIEKGFSACFLVKKVVNEEDFDGIWNSSHLVHVSILSKDQAKYEVKSTVLLSITNAPTSHPPVNESISSSSIKTGGSLSKQVEKVCSYKNDSNSHVSNIGHIIEEVETELRSSSDSLYIQKNKELANCIRSEGDEEKNRHGMMQVMMGQGNAPGVSSELHAAMMASLKKRMG